MCLVGKTGVKQHVTFTCHSQLISDLFIIMLYALDAKLIDWYLENNYAQGKVYDAQGKL